MGHQYVAIGWNRQKKLYDLYILLFAGLYLLGFNFISQQISPDITFETLFIRSTGSLAILLLHVILCIGPLCRLFPKLLPLLYNRRHLGVSMALLATAHGVFSIIQFHTQGDTAPLTSLLTSNTNFTDFGQFPFMLPGFCALIILLLMAATSHDFWLNFLGAPVWKALHMAVYFAYLLLLLHVLTGSYQQNHAPALLIFLGAGAVSIISLHLIAGWKETPADRPAKDEEDSWVKACHIEDIPDNRAKVIRIGNERVAIFKYDKLLAATSNVCQHQNGPLGEGCVIDGLITCPWHGYQYRPEDGCSPPPFTEKVATYRLKMTGEEVWIYLEAEAPGTPVTPLKIPDAHV